MRRRWTRFLLAVTLMVCGGAVSAEDLIMIRSTQAFPEAMVSLQEAITTQGYTLSRVQRVDIGLTAMGFSTDMYRVVFYGKPEEIKLIVRRYPELIPYVPLKIAIYAENEQTLLVAANPSQYRDFYSDPELAKRFARWESDLRAILEQVRGSTH